MLFIDKSISAVETVSSRPSRQRAAAGRARVAGKEFVQWKSHFTGTRIETNSLSEINHFCWGLCFVHVLLSARGHCWLCEITNTSDSLIFSHSLPWSVARGRSVTAQRLWFHWVSCSSVHMDFHISQTIRTAREHLLACDCKAHITKKYVTLVSPGA